MLTDWSALQAVRAYLTAPLSVEEIARLREMQSKCAKFKKGNEEW